MKYEDEAKQIVLSGACGPHSKLNTLHGMILVLVEKARADAESEAIEKCAKLCERARIGLKDSKQKAADTCTYLARDIRAMRGIR